MKCLEKNVFDLGTPRYQLIQTRKHRKRHAKKYLIRNINNLAITSNTDFSQASFV
jgi:hypothetical protein